MSAIEEISPQKQLLKTFTEAMFSFIESSFNNRCSFFAPKELYWKHMTSDYLNGESLISCTSTNQRFDVLIKTIRNYINLQKGSKSSTRGKDLFFRIFLQINEKDLNSIRSEISLYFYFLYWILEIHDCDPLRSNTEFFEDLLIRTEFLYNFHRKIRSIGGKLEEVYTNQKLVDIYFRYRKMNFIDIRNIHFPMILHQ